jgi:PAT family beta-lactamase induction signal transducer AmpG
MALGMMLPEWQVDSYKKYLGYGNFFIWVFLATIPGLILSRFLIFPYDFGNLKLVNSSDYEVLDV